MRFTTYLEGATTLNSSRDNYISYLLLDTMVNEKLAQLLKLIIVKPRAIRSSDTPN